MIDEAWPVDGLERVPACPVCGSETRSILHRGMSDCVFGTAPGRWDLWRCAECASGYLDPRPTPQTIGLAYADYFTHSADDRRFIRRAGRMRAFLLDLINGYQNRRYSLSWSPSSRFGRWLLPLLPSLRAAADCECRHLPKLPVGGGRLLDVGCGNGAFLALARQTGWEVQGLDFDQGAVNAARSRGLDVRHGGIELLADVSNAYDVVTLSHVVEHVHDPITLLANIQRLLKPGGRLWLKTPNLASVGANEFGSDWRDMDPPRHLVLFNRGSLQSALRRAGFSAIEWKFHGLAVFDVFAASEAIRSKQRGAEASYAGKPPLHAVLVEILESLLGSKREFLTCVAFR